MKYGIKIFEDLNNEQIKYIVWKNTNLIDKFFNGKENLDIFIHRDHQERFKFLLKKIIGSKLKAPVIILII